MYTTKCEGREVRIVRLHCCCKIITNWQCCKSA